MSIDSSFDTPEHFEQHTQNSPQAGKPSMDRGSDIGDSWQRAGGRVQLGATRLLREQPLMVALVGIALGAMLGAALPASHKERQLVGAARDKLAATGQAGAPVVDAPGGAEPTASAQAGNGKHADPVTRPRHTPGLG